jgi:hypothetical protein
VSVVEEPVEERTHGGDIAEELAPVLDRAIGREERADAFVPALDEFEEILGRGGGELVWGLCPLAHRLQRGPAV